MIEVMILTAVGVGVISSVPLFKHFKGVARKTLAQQKTLELESVADQPFELEALVKEHRKLNVSEAARRKRISSVSQKRRMHLHRAPARNLSSSSKVLRSGSKSEENSSYLISAELERVR